MCDGFMSYEYCMKEKRGFPTNNCKKILQGRLWTTGKNIWISVVLAFILAGAEAL